MKQNLILPILITLICAIFVSCTVESSENDVEIPQISDSSIRSYEEVLKIAQQGIDILEGNSVTRSPYSHRSIDTANGIRVIKSKITRSGENTPLIYVVNFNDNQGYAIVSANPSTIGLLGVAESGSYDESGTQNEGLEFFMKLAGEYASAIIPGDGFEPIIPLHVDSYCGPYVTVRWGQDWPTGYFCSNENSGCTNTAMAQIMSYYEYPTGINLTYNNADVSYQALNWTNIKKHIFGNDSTQCLNHTNPWCTADRDSHLALAKLCKQLVFLNQSNDTDTLGTGTNRNRAKDTFVSLGYSTSSDWIEYTTACLVNSLNNHRLILMHGYDVELWASHCWISDGYYCQDEITPGALIGGGDAHFRTYYNHINWGWNGEDNGYYLDNVFDTSNCYSVDSLAGTSPTNFNDDVEYIEVYR